MRTFRTVNPTAVTMTYSVMLTLVFAGVLTRKGMKYWELGSGGVLVALDPHQVNIPLKHSVGLIITDVIILPKYERTTNIIDTNFLLTSPRDS